MRAALSHCASFKDPVGRQHVQCGCGVRPPGDAALGPRERLPVAPYNPITRDRAAAELGYTDDLGNLWWKREHQ